jgi:hypothetical protein
VLSVEALNSAIDCFLCRLAIGNWLEPWWLTWPRRSAPVDHVAVVSAVRVQRETIVGQEAPAFGIGRHLSNLRSPTNRGNSAVARFRHRPALRALGFPPDTGSLIFPLGLWVFH